MKFPFIPEPYDTILRLLLFAVIIYYYFKNKNKKQDQEKINLNRTIGLSFIAFAMVSSCIIVILYHDDPIMRDRMFGYGYWIGLALFTSAILFVEYYSSRRKKQLNNHPEPNQ